jgi:hypothetical protein
MPSSVNQNQPIEVIPPSSIYKIQGPLRTYRPCKPDPSQVFHIPRYDPAVPGVFGDALGNILGDGMGNPHGNPPSAGRLLQILGVLDCLYHKEHEPIPLEIFLDGGLGLTLTELAVLARDHELVHVKVDRAGKLFLKLPGRLSPDGPHDLRKELLQWVLRCPIHLRVTIFNRAMEILASLGPVWDDGNDFPRHDTLQRMMDVYKIFSNALVIPAQGAAPRPARLPKPVALRFGRYLLGRAG